MKENNVHYWKKAYEISLWEKLKSTEPGKAVNVSSFDGKKQGRLPLLHTKLDLMLQEQIIITREQGTSIGSSTVIGIGRKMLLKHGKAACMNLVTYCMEENFGRRNVGKFGESFVIRQTKTIQISTYNK